MESNQRVDQQHRWVDRFILPHRLFVSSVAVLLIAAFPMVKADEPDGASGEFRPGVCPPFNLRDERGSLINPVTGHNVDVPYSPRQTCGACHDYDKITEGFHFTQGKGELPTAEQAVRCGWVTSPGNYGGTW